MVPIGMMTAKDMWEAGYCHMRSQAGLNDADSRASHY